MLDVDAILGLGVKPEYPRVAAENTSAQRPAYQEKPAFSGGSSFGQMLMDDDPLYPMPPAFTVAIYLNKETPAEVIDRVKNLVSSLLKTRFSVRYKTVGEAAIDIPVFEAANAASLSYTTIELIIPWKEFSMEFLPMSKHLTKVGYGAKRVTAAITEGWVGLKPAIKAFRGTETHLVLGKAGISPAVAIVTYSNDGAEKLESLTQETKFNKNVYRMAKMFNIPIFNLRDSDAVNRLERRLADFPLVKE